MEFRDRIMTKVIECGQVGRKRVARDRIVVSVLFLGGAVPRNQMYEKSIQRGNLQSLAEVRNVIAGVTTGWE
jgi:hypothetical protein